MRTGLVRLGLLLAFAMLIVLGAACDEESSDEKKQKACEELAQLNAALVKFDAIGPGSSIDQLKDARNEVKQQADDARRAIREYNESKAEELETSADNLKKAVDDVSGSQSIAEARASIQEELVAVRASWEKLTAGLNCR
jgi:hypothetical protein